MPSEPIDIGDGRPPASDPAVHELDVPLDRLAKGGVQPARLVPELLLRLARRVAPVLCHQRERLGGDQYSAADRPGRGDRCGDVARNHEDGVADAREVGDPLDQVDPADVLAPEDVALPRAAVLCRQQVTLRDVLDVHDVGRAVDDRRQPAAQVVADDPVDVSPGWSRFTGTPST